MRIVGLSGGRRSGNNELMLKTALAAAKQVCGAELEIIRLQDLKLRDCIGCETCMRGLTTGGDGLCVVRDDDMPWFSAAVKEADALILATPIYDLIPTGTVVTLLNRVLGIGKEYQTYCRTHPKIGAAMALGGSDWVNLTEPLMDLTVRNLSKGSVIVDKFVVGHNPAPSMVVLDEAVLERAALLGRRVGEALMDREHAGFAGDSGVCPACHCNLLEPRGGARVGCPYCDAEGTAVIRDGSLVVEWDADKVRDNRFGPAGDAHHRADIPASHKKAGENRERIRQRVQELEDFDGVFVQPPKRDPSTTKE